MIEVNLEILRTVRLKVLLGKRVVLAYRHRSSASLVVPARRWGGGGGRESVPHIALYYSLLSRVYRDYCEALY